MRVAPIKLAHHRQNIGIQFGDNLCTHIAKYPCHCHIVNEWSQLTR